ncbi:MAG: hypothetical protein ACN6I4_00305 [bacterium]
MKKLVVLVIVCIISHHFVSAQTQKGSFYFGAIGTASNIFDSENRSNTVTSTQTMYNFSAGINAGYFIKNNWSLGVTALYNSSLRLTPNTIPSNTENVFWSAPIHLTLHARRYFMPNPRFGVYGQLRSGIVTGIARNMLRFNGESNLLLSEANLTGYSSALGAGITWFPLKKAKRLNVDVLVNILSYSAITTDYKDPSTRNTEINTTFSFFQTSVGLNYYIFKQPDTK